MPARDRGARRTGTRTRRWTTVVVLAVAVVAGIALRTGALAWHARAPRAHEHVRVRRPTVGWFTLVDAPGNEVEEGQTNCSLPGYGSFPDPVERDQGDVVEVGSRRIDAGSRGEVLEGPRFGLVRLRLDSGVCSGKRPWILADALARDPGSP